MSDGMTNIQSRSLLNCICSNPAGQFFVKVIDTSGKVKTKEYIAEEAILMIEAEGPENVAVLIMDGACRSAFPLINAKYPHVICLICCAHGLDLTLEDFAKPDEQGPVVAGRALCLQHVVRAWHFARQPRDRQVRDEPPGDARCLPVVSC
jgi:hypothetical protein